MKKAILLLLAFCLCPLGASLRAATTVNDLRVEYLTNPIGIDVEQPRFSWKLTSDERGVTQTAYQIKLFSDEKGEKQVWTSGKVVSDKSLHIVYGGTALHASTRYYWTVDVWDQQDVLSSTKEPAFFETGLMKSGWSDAQWIKSEVDKSPGDDAANVTDYTLSVDFELVNIAAGVIFGYKDSGNFYMWQINREKAANKTFLRPHSWKDGGAQCHADIDITNKIHVELGKTYTLTIRVEGNQATTFIDDIEVDKRQNPRGGNYGLGLVGFRMNKAEQSNAGEEAYFDNVKVISPDGKDVYVDEDFSVTSQQPFSFGENKNGRWYVLGSITAPLSVQQTQSDLSFDLEMDVTVVNQCAGIIFSAQNKTNFYMWQLNLSDSDEPMIRRHFYRGGDPATSEKKFGSLYTKDQLLGKEQKVKIEVRGKTIKTYIGGKEVDNYTDASGPAVVQGIGFRAHSGGNVNEVAYYDNVKLTQYLNNQPQVLIDDDFEHELDGYFSGYESIRVGTTSKLKMSSPSSDTRIFDDSMDGIRSFRTEFDLPKTVASARIYSSALGVYDLFINGRRVGTPTSDGKMIYDELKPGWTDYTKTIFYTTYDVTGLLKTGANAIGAQVSSGWWAGGIAHGKYGSPSLGFIAKLLVTYSDGSTAIVVTDPGKWKSSQAGPFRMGDIYDGENYDARREDAWAEAGYDDSQWLPTVVNSDFKGQITGFVGPQVQIRPELERVPLSLTRYKGASTATNGHGMVNVLEKKKGTDKLSLKTGETAVYDMGQNMVGWVRFKVKGQAGTRVTIRFAEMLNDDGSNARHNDGPGGSLYRALLRGAKATLNYTLRGDADGEEFRSSMSFYGFRYCDVVASGDIELEDMRGEVVGTAAVEGVSSFTTSHDAVNQLCRNIIWGQRGNFLSIPTDCPQRDERLGWTGDILAFGRTASYNADLSGFFHKWMGDMRDSQRSDGAYPDIAPHCWLGNSYGGSAWADAGIVIPWTTYLMYGNPGILEENYASMEKYMAFVASQGSNEYKYNGPVAEYGDWVAYEATDKRYISVCFYAYDALLMADISAALSKSQNDAYARKAKTYKALYENIKAEFGTRYVNADGSLKQSSQAAHLLALRFDLFPDKASRDKGIATLNQLLKNNNNTLKTGFVGTAIINQVLSESGLNDMAYNLLLQRNNPSWLYTVDQGGTTMWERWDAYTKENGFNPNIGMNSYNHYAYGAVMEWMYSYMAGINPDKTNPGFKQILITPHLDKRTSLPAGQERITKVDATYDSYYGPIRSAWTIAKDGGVTYEFTIPANTTATIELDVNSFWDDLYDGETLIDKNFKGLVSYQRGNQKARLVLGSGRYTITIKDKTGKEIVETAEQLIYPNPVSGLLNIKSDEAIETLSLFTLGGNLLYQQAGNEAIDMETYPVGIYLLEVKSPNSSKNWKVIKE